MPTFLYTTMDNMDELTRSLADPAPRVKVGVYVVEPTCFKIYNVSGGDTVEGVLRSLVGPFVSSVYKRYDGTPSRTGRTEGILFPQGTLRGCWVN